MSTLVLVAERFSNDIEVRRPDPSLLFEDAEVVAVHSLPGSDAKLAYSQALVTTEGKVVILWTGYSFTDSAWMAFISVLDLNNGFEFDVRLPLGGQSTERPRAVLTPENDLFFVSYNRVMRWGYLSSALTTVWTARPAHHAYDVMLFVGGSGFSEWDTSGGTGLHVFDASGVEVDIVVPPAGVIIGENQDHAHLTAIPYTDTSGAQTVFGTYNLVTSTYTPLVTYPDESAEVKYYADAAGVTVIVSVYTEVSEDIIRFMRLTTDGQVIFSEANSPVGGYANADMIPCASFTAVVPLVEPI